MTHRYSLVNNKILEQGWQIQSRDWVFLGDAETIVGLELCFGIGNVYSVLIPIIGDCITTKLPFERIECACGIQFCIMISVL